MSLKEYRRKRNFAITREPQAEPARHDGRRRRFVIQKHAATRLHYDFRLELGRKLVSWAVPKGLPLEKGEKRLAVRVEDHPVEYLDFEGTIPKGQYGGGTVQVWDIGEFKTPDRSPLKNLAAGKLHFELHGKKLHGSWHLVRLRGQHQWLIIRGGGNHPRLSRKQQNVSALSGRTMSQIAAGSSTRHEKIAARRVSPSQRRRVEVAFTQPMKARLVDKPPAGDWQYEVKFDGFRAFAFKADSAVWLISRSENDLTGRFPALAQALAKVKARQAVIDGEIVALDKKGRSSFQLLQAYDLGQERPPLCYYAFDLLSLDGQSTMRLPLIDRKGKLRKLLPTGRGPVRFSASLGSNAAVLMKKAAAMGLEGLIGKRKDSVYEPGRRSGAWIKLKRVAEQEFVIGGYTDPGGSRKHLGALLVGIHEKGRLLYAGKVGTGFDAAILRDLHRRLSRLRREHCPFADIPEKRPGSSGQGISAAMMKKCHWVQPKLVCQIKFAEWTRDSRLRQPVYLGSREDKPARSVVRETPA